MNPVRKKKLERAKSIRAIKAFLKEQKQKAFKYGLSVSEDYNKDYFLLGKVIGNKTNKQ